MTALIHYPRDGQPLKVLETLHNNGVLVHLARGNPYVHFSFDKSQACQARM